MGLERLDRLRQEFNVSITGRAFILRPDTPREGRPRQPRPGESDDELSEPLRTYAKQAGLVMRRPSLVPNTLLALQATEYAQEQGLFDPFHRSLYRAYWEDGKDLGNLDVIGEVAQGVGLDWPELKARLESGHYHQTVVSQYEEALALGIHGIPAFLIGNFLFTGARPYEVFRAVAQRVLAGEGR